MYQILILVLVLCINIYYHYQDFGINGGIFRMFGCAFSYDPAKSGIFVCGQVSRTHEFELEAGFYLHGSPNLYVIFFLIAFYQ